MQIISKEFTSVFDGKTQLSLVAQTKTDNRKTGNIPSMWLTVGSTCPAELYKCGQDHLVCGTCRRRSKKSGGNGSCYTNGTELHMGANMLWKGLAEWKTMGIKNMCRKIKVESGKNQIRMLRHGDSCAIPENIVNTISDEFLILGYTHGWRFRPDLKSTHMASVESIEELGEAMDLGWRTFRAVKRGESYHNSEILCPNLTAGIKCEHCLMCTGTATKAKNIVIYEH